MAKMLIWQQLGGFRICGSRAENTAGTGMYQTLLI
jgi:hypothetical protein